MGPKSAPVLAFILLAAAPACLASQIGEMLSPQVVFPQVLASSGPVAELLTGQGEAAPAAAAPADAAPAAAATPDKLNFSIAAGLEFGGVFSQNHDFGVVGGLGFFGLALLEKKLAPEKPFPFPAVGTAEADFFYAPGKDGVSDYLFALRFGFGLNLLHMKPGTMFYPYATLGMGFESVTGSIKIGSVRRDVSEARFILPMGFGVGFAMEVSPKVSFFARVEFGFPVNSANISGLLRVQGGVLMML